MLWAIIIGLIVGAIAKLVMPGKDPGGIIVTILLGIAGSFVGTLIGRTLGFYGSGQGAGIIMSILGAVLLMMPFGLIPFSNTFPAVALLLLAIGLLQRDGVSVLLGHISNIVTILYFALLIGGGGLAVREVFQRMTA